MSKIGDNLSKFSLNRRAIRLEFEEILTRFPHFSLRQPTCKQTLGFLSFIFITLSANAETLATKRGELSHVSGQIQSLKKSIEHNQTESVNLQLQLKNAEVAIGKSDAQISRLTKELAAQQKILNELALTEQTTELRLKVQNDALNAQLRAAYKLGTQNQLKILLNQENMNTANRHLLYYKTLNETREKLIADIQQNLVLLQATVKASSIHQQTLKKLLTEKQNQQKRQQRILILRQQVITALGLQTQDKQRQVDVLIANQKALQETIARLQQTEIAITGQPFNQLQNKLSWPVKGQFVTYFGSAEDGGARRATGMTIKTPSGTPVHAIYSGRVVFADWLRGFGLLVIINHGHQYMSLYGRNQTLYIKPGQLVRTGDVIAAAGNSGGYSNSGLYFEIRQNGTPVNPGIWCR